MQCNNLSTKYELIRIYESVMWKKISRLSILLAIVVSSCTPQKKLVYFQGNFNAINDTSSANYFKLKIIPGDILIINVFTVNPEAFPYFNVASEKQSSDTRSPYEKGYTVSERGTIE